jgi:hypothetical protein
MNAKGPYKISADKVVIKQNVSLAMLNTAIMKHFQSLNTINSPLYYAEAADWPCGYARVLGGKKVRWKRIKKSNSN